MTHDPHSKIGWLTDGQSTPSLYPDGQEELAAFGASDAACHLYPGEDQQAERAAFCAGAAHAVSTPKPEGETVTDDGGDGDLLADANGWYSQAQVDDMERDSRGALACKCGTFPRPMGDHCSHDDGYRSMWCSGCMKHVVGWKRTEAEAVAEWNRLREIELTTPPNAPAALAKPAEGTVPDDGLPSEADAEVERILSLSDDQVLAEASPEDLAWARLFKARLIAIKHALPGRYDGTSTYAVVRGEADDAPYMLAIREALAASPKPTETVTDDGWVMVPRVPTEAMMKAAGGFPHEFRKRWDRVLAASPKPTIVEASGVVERRYRNALQDIAEAEAIPNDAVAFVWCRDVARQALSASSPSSEQGRAA